MEYQRCILEGRGVGEILKMHLGEFGNVGGLPEMHLGEWRCRWNTRYAS